ncbi:MAG: alpha/beta hydrolase [Oscillochloris sp.]|nr:alpha/beta hydrolase [Oscillochloris sp.]
MQRVALNDGATIAYHDLGSGPPVLLMHGFTGTARVDMGVFIDDLSRDYRVIAPDLRGYGASRPPNRSFPPDFYQRDAADMAQLLSRLAPGPTTVIGFSDGAESALLLAAQWPELIRATVAFGVCGIISPAMVESVQVWLPTDRWAIDRVERRREIVELHGEEQFAPMVEGWVRAAEVIAAAGGDVALNASRRITCPTLLINGDREVGNPLEDVRRLAAHIPDCRLEVVADSGHSIQRDQPAALLRIVRVFLTSLDAQ